MSFLLRRTNLLILSAVAFLLADAAIVYIAAHGDFAFDFTCCYQQAGQRLLNDPSSLYAWSSTYTFRYSPWAALLFAPLASLTQGQAIVVFLLLKAALVGLIATWYSDRWTGTERAFVAGAVLLFPPLWHDLALGNVSTFTVLVLLALLRWPDLLGGALLGLLLLLAPKPHLLPVAGWLAVRRPRAAVAALSVLGAGFLVGLPVFGVGAWGAYLATFREPLETTFTANIGFSGLLGPAGVIVGVAAAVAIWVAALRRPGAIGLGLAIVSGVVAGPYTFIHYLSGLLVAAEPVLRARPRWLAPFPWLLVVFPLIAVWVVGFGTVLWRFPRSLVRGRSAA